MLEVSARRATRPRFILGEPPAPVNQRQRFALFAAQQGMTDPAAKPHKGFGGNSVFEIVVSRHGSAWRGVHTVRLRTPSMSCMYSRRSPQKGIPTPAGEMGLIGQRLLEAERDHAEKAEIP
jgi:phage-related protein